MIKPLRGRVFVLSLVAALVLSLVPAVPAGAVPAATTIYVNAATGSDVTGDGTEGAPLKSITEALEIAGDGTTIMVADGTYSDADTGEVFPLAVSSLSGVSIIADTWATIDGAGSVQVMSITASDVTLENLAITGGFSSSKPGGALEAIDSVITLVNCEVYDNTAPVGGGVFAIGATLDFQMSSLHNNGVIVGINPVEIIPVECQAGGAVFAVEGSEVSLTDSAVYDNGALFAGAGLYSSMSTVTAVGSSFFGNVTTDSQVGIGSLSKSSASNSVWNSADGVSTLADSPVDGGAIASMMGAVDVSGCGFFGNSAYNGSSIMGAVSQVSITDSYFSGDYAADGVVYVLDEALIPTAIKGLAIEPTTPLPMSATSLDADNCWFDYNDAMAVFVCDGGEGSITNSVFQNNSTWMGPLIGLLGAPGFEVTNITTANNQVDNAPVWDNTGMVRVSNSIIWDEGPLPNMAPNSTVEPTQIEGYGSVYGCDVSYSDLMSLNSAAVTPVAVEGPGVISTDPLFADLEAGDLELGTDSPCVDTGSDLQGTAPDHDIVGAARPIDGDGDGDAAWDMGAFEYGTYASGRISGQDRFETSVQIAQEHFVSADTAVLATGRAFADGLCGSGLAGAYDAPILLTDSRVLPADVAAELVRLGVSHVVLLGGEDAISADVEAAVAALGDIAIERIGGVDRYETASMIADEIEALVGPAYLTFVARGDAFPDALAASPVAYGNTAPVLLVGPDELPDTTVGYIAAASSAKTVIIGGTDAVSAGVEDGIKVAAAGPVSRITGEDRYDTAAQVAEWAYDWGFADFGFVGVATGEDFADALSGGAAIGARGGVLVLTDPYECPLVTEDVIVGNASDIGTLEVFGGPNAVTDDVVDYIMGLWES